MAACGTNLQVLDAACPRWSGGVLDDTWLCRSAVGVPAVGTVIPLSKRVDAGGDGGEHMHWCCAQHARK